MSRPVLLRLIAHTAISAALVAVLLWRGDINAFFRALRGADAELILVAAAFIGASKLMHGVRWWLLVRRTGPVPLRAAVLVLLVATGVSVILPLRAGAALQVQLLRRRFGVERAAVAGTLLLEGAIDAAPMIVIAVALAPLLHLRRSLVATAAIATAAVAVAFALLLLAGRLGLIRALPRWLPSRTRTAAAALVHGLMRGLATAGSIRYVGLLVGVTLIDWALASAGLALAGQAFGLGVPPQAYLAVELAGNLSGAVPLTQANVGPYELVVRETLTAFGAPGDPAAAFAVASHAAIIVAEVAMALVSAWALGLSRADLFYLRAERPGMSAP